MYRNYGDHKVPEPFKDEDKWVKLTKRQICIALPVIILCGIILTTTWNWGILPIGIIFSVLLLISGGICMIVKIPEEKYLFGSGLFLEQLAFRILKKKLPMNKKIYTKFYDNGYREW